MKDYKEYQGIIKSLRSRGYNKKEIAAELGVSRVTLNKMLKKLGLYNKRVL